MSDYDADVLAWSERQADLIRRVAAGEPPNETPDWLNIIEELRDVGRSELRSCRSLLRQALRHMLKAEGWPLSRDAPTWRADAIDFPDMLPAMNGEGSKVSLGCFLLHRRCPWGLSPTLLSLGAFTRVEHPEPANPTGLNASRQATSGTSCPRPWPFGFDILILHSLVSSANHKKKQDALTSA